MQSAIQRFGMFLAMMLASVWLFATDLTPVPPLTAPVMDTAEMMQPAAREELNAHLLRYSREKGSQIVVLTVPTINPETPFDYAARVMEAWKLGRKDISDGVLLLLVRDERKSHLAVGRGLEGAIPDVYAKRILEDVLRPYLRAGEPDKGIAVAVAQIEKLIAGEPLPEVNPIDRYAGDSGDGWIMLLILPVFAGGFFRTIFGRAFGSLITGGLTFFVAWVLGFGLIVAVLAALVGTVIAFAVGSGAFISGGGSGRGGGFGGGFGGGSGGWSSGGGFGGGGGFSGGGGSFGGGGASGGW